MSSAEEVQDDLHDLLFGVRRSIRYHNCRRGFFDSLQTISQIASVLFGSATFFAVLSSAGKIFTMVAAAAVTLLSTINIVIGPSKKAQLHTELSRRFIDLEKLIIGTDIVTEQKIREFKRQRLEIERDEPAILRCLDSLCHNEELRAAGYEEEYFVMIKGYQRLFANIIDINHHAIRRAGILNPTSSQQSDKKSDQTSAV